MRIDDYRPSWPTPATGWPNWLSSVPYVGSQHPLADPLGPIEAGANCQRYAYAVLAQFRVWVPPVRSSELWTHPGIRQVPPQHLRPLDLVLFNAKVDPFGAHVGMHMAPDQVLHLCAETGRPVVWGYADFEARLRYRQLLGGVRPLAADLEGRTAAWAQVCLFGSALSVGCAADRDFCPCGGTARTTRCADCTGFGRSAGYRVRARSSGVGHREWSRPT